MSYIEKVNKEIERQTKEYGITPATAIYNMALTAGISNFNPAKATETEIMDYRKSDLREKARV